MGDEQSIIPSPQEGQTLEQYLQTFADTELQQICSNSELLTKFCSILQESFRGFERVEDGLENLWNIIRRLNNVDRLLYCIRRLEPERRELLDSLEQNAEAIQRSCTYSTIGRLVGSSFDIVGTVAGLIMKDGNPGYANLAFRVATSFGLMGLVSTVSEMSTSKNTLDDLMRLIARDQEFFAPLQQWYQQTDELEEAMQAVFPFDITNQVVADFADMGGTEFTPVRLFTTLLRSIAQKDIRYMRDETLIRNLINFTLYPASRDWCEWIIFRRHPIMLDIARVIMQLHHSPLRYALCQSIPALALADQDIRAFPVWGRMIVNLITVVDSITTLRSSTISTLASEMGHLHRHLQSELVSLLRIAEFIRLRRRQ